jgi:hypothetical protein
MRDERTHPGWPAQEGAGSDEEKRARTAALFAPRAAQDEPAAPAPPPRSHDPCEAALWAVGVGLWPVPLHPAGAKLRTEGGHKVATGKEPIGMAWGTQRPTPESLRAAYARTPGAEVGLLLGPASGVVDLEVDEPDGEESLRRLFGGEVLDTLSWSSRRGPHRLYQWDDRLAVLSSGTLHLPAYPGLEIRCGADGRQLQSAIPPTVGEDGVPREWGPCPTIGTLPDQVVTRILELARAPRQAHPTQTGQASARSARTGTRQERWFSKALAGEATKVATALARQRHNRLLASARILGGMLHHGFLREAAVIAVLTDAARRSGLPEAEIAATVRDGLAKGREAPLDWPPALDQQEEEDPRRNGRATPRVEAAAPADDDALPIPVRPWPERPAAAAYHGLTGQIVRAIEPETGSDPVALLAQLLVMFGSAVGRSLYYKVESTFHHANENLVLVGETAMGRKGTAADRARDLLRRVDPVWADTRVMGGLSSGEGLISAVRDPVTEKQPIKKKGIVESYHDVMTDAGVEDKRLLAMESEFGGVLRVLDREGNKLSALVRQAWDHGTLATLTKSPFRATRAHVSIIGYVTAIELRALLSGLEQANGLANRFLWLCVRRSKLLPHGGCDLDLNSLTSRLMEVVTFSRHVERMKMTDAARTLWESHYARLTTPPPGTLGLITSRAAPHTLRLAMLYALTDCTARIAVDHLEAALALWNYAVRSAAYIFGDETGNKDADRILAAIRAAPEGMTQSELRLRVFNNNIPADRVQAALAL